MIKIGYYNSVIPNFILEILTFVWYAQNNLDTSLRLIRLPEIMNIFEIRFRVMGQIQLQTQFQVTLINNINNSPNYTTNNYAMWRMQLCYLHIERTLIFQKPRAEWENCKASLYKSKSSLRQDISRWTLLFLLDGYLSAYS